MESNPSNVYRGNDSNLAQLIKSDEQFINEFNKSFSQLDDNAKYGEFEISFTNNTDLYYSIYNARIEYYIYDIDENVKYIEFYLYDTYDYTQFKLIDEGISFPNFANDMARLSQMLGAINEFDIVVKFNLTIYV